MYTLKKKESEVKNMMRLNLGKKRKTDLERLKKHFGKNWKKHKISELPPRGTGKGKRR